MTLRYTPLLGSRPGARVADSPSRESLILAESPSRESLLCDSARLGQLWPSAVGRSPLSRQDIASAAPVPAPAALSPVALPRARPLSPLAAPAKFSLAAPSKIVTCSALVGRVVLFR